MIRGHVPWIGLNPRIPRSFVPSMEFLDDGAGARQKQESALAHTRACEDDELGGNTRPEVGGLLGDGASDGRALHLTLVAAAGRQCQRSAGRAATSPGKVAPWG